MPVYRSLYIHLVGNMDLRIFSFSELQNGTRNAAIDGHCLYRISGEIDHFFIYGQFIFMYRPVIDIAFNRLRTLSKQLKRKCESKEEREKKIFHYIFFRITGIGISYKLVSFYRFLYESPVKTYHVSI